MPVTRLAVVFALLLLAGGVVSRSTHADDLPAVRLFAAGSLQAALSEAGKEFSVTEKIPVETNFGPSGVLRDRIEKGEPGDLFASADMGNPLALFHAGKA